MNLEDSLRTIVREELERVLRAPEGPAAPPPRWLTLSALAEHLGLSRATVYALVARGLPHIQPDKTKRFNLAECEQWIRDQKLNAAAE